MHEATHSARWPRASPQADLPGELHIRFFLAFPLFFTLGFVFPLIACWLVGVQTSSRLEPAMAWAVVLYSGGRLSLFAARGEMRLLSLTFWTFVYVWLGVAPLSQLLSDGFPHRGVYDRQTIIYAFLIVALGILGFELGQLVYHRRAASGELSRYLPRRELDMRRTLLLAVATLTVATIAVSQIGGFGTFLASREAVSRAVQSVAGDDFADRYVMLLMIVRVPPFIAMYLLWWTWLRRGSRLNLHLNLFVALLLLVSVVVNVIVGNPVNSPRYWFGMVVVAMVFITIPFRGRWWFAVWTLVFAAVLLIVFPYADMFRRDVNLTDVYFSGIEPLVEKADYDAFQQLLNAVTFVEEKGLSHGRQMLGTILFWVPRRVWPTKPVPSGNMVAESVGYGFTNLAMPLWAEAYLDGGVALVLVLLGGYGFVMAALERGYLRNRWEKDTPVAFLVPILAAYQFLLLRGSLMSSFGHLVPVIGLILIATRPKPEGTPRRRGNRKE